jgi:hypothetical protein
MTCNESAALDAQGVLSHLARSGGVRCPFLPTWSSPVGVCPVSVLLVTMQQKCHARCARTFAKIFVWSLVYFLRDYLSAIAGAPTSLALSLLIKYQILCRVVKVCLCPALPPWRIPPLEGCWRAVLRCSDVLLWVLPQLEGRSSFPATLLSSCFPTTLSPHPVVELSQIVGG